MPSSVLQYVMCFFGLYDWCCFPLPSYFSFFLLHPLHHDLFSYLSDSILHFFCPCNLPLNFSFCFLFFLPTLIYVFCTLFIFLTLHPPSLPSFFIFTSSSSPVFMQVGDFGEQPSRHPGATQNFPEYVSFAG